MKLVFLMMGREQLLLTDEGEDEKDIEEYTADKMVMMIEKKEEVV